METIDERAWFLECLENYEDRWRLANNGDKAETEERKMVLRTMDTEALRRMLKRLLKG